MPTLPRGREFSQVTLGKLGQPPSWACAGSCDSLFDLNEFARYQTHPYVSTYYKKRSKVHYKWVTGLLESPHFPFISQR